jgi:hypothetical protein
MLVVPITWEVEIRELSLKAGWGKNVRPYLENKLKVKVLEAWLKWYSTYLASMRS